MLSTALSLRGAKGRVATWNRPKRRDGAGGATGPPGCGPHCPRPGRRGRGLGFHSASSAAQHPRRPRPRTFHVLTRARSRPGGRMNPGGFRCTSAPATPTPQQPHRLWEVGKGARVPGPPGRHRVRVKPCGPVHGPCAEATCPSVEGRLAERKTPPVGASTEARKRTWPRDASPGTHGRGSVDPCAGPQGLRGRAWGARGGGGPGKVDA